MLKLMVLTAWGMTTLFLGNTPAMAAPQSGAGYSTEARATGGDSSLDTKKDNALSFLKNKQKGFLSWSKATLLLLTKVAIVLLIVACIFTAPLLTSSYLAYITWIGDPAHVSTLIKYLTAFCLLFVGAAEYQAQVALQKLGKKILSKLIVSFIVFLASLVIHSIVFNFAGVITSIIKTVLWFFYGYLMVALLIGAAFFLNGSSLMLELGIIGDTRGVLTGNPALSTWHFVWLIMFIVFVASMSAKPVAKKAKMRRKFA